MVRSAIMRGLVERFRELGFQTTTAVDDETWFDALDRPSCETGISGMLTLWRASDDLRLFNAPIRYLWFGGGSTIIAQYSDHSRIQFDYAEPGSLEAIEEFLVNGPSMPTWQRTTTNGANT